MPSGYKKNYLKNVIARIDLLKPIEKISDELPKDLTSILLKNYPISERKKLVEGAFKIDAARGIFEESARKEMKLWLFHSVERTKTVTLGNNFLILEYRKYDDVVDFQKDFLELSGKYLSIPETQVRRFGIRYINNIQIDEKLEIKDWAKFINPDLLSILRVKRDDDQLTRAFQILAIKKGQTNLLFQYGIYNPDYPAPVVKNSFILDYDCYQLGEIEISEIASQFDKCHELIKDYFKKSITIALERKMKNG